jgi:hypothetical protein
MGTVIEAVPVAGVTANFLTDAPDRPASLGETYCLGSQRAGSRLGLALLAATRRIALTFHRRSTPAAVS